MEKGGINGETELGFQMLSLNMHSRERCLCIRTSVSVVLELVLTKASLPVLTIVMLRELISVDVFN